MTSSKSTTLAGTALALLASLSLGAGVAHAEQKAAPAAKEATAPEVASPDIAAPAAPDMATPDSAAPDSAEVAPVKRQEPVAPPTAAAQPSDDAADAKSAAADAPVALSAKSLEIGTAVFGADGAKIGEVNRVLSNASGGVEEIHVTSGGPAGLGAKVFAVAADKIVVDKDGVKLSLSSEEAKKLPLLGNGNS